MAGGMYQPTRFGTARSTQRNLGVGSSIGGQIVLDEPAVNDTADLQLRAAHESGLELSGEVLLIRIVMATGATGRGACDQRGTSVAAFRLIHV